MTVATWILAVATVVIAIEGAQITRKMPRIQLRRRDLDQLADLLTRRVTEIMGDGLMTGDGSGAHGEMRTVLRIVARQFDLLAEDIKNRGNELGE